MSAKGSLIASVAVLVFAAAVHAGGWSVTTVRDLPEYAVARKPLRLTFTVRGHGLTPIDGLLPLVEATSGADTVTVLAAATRKQTGEYSAAIVLPRPGTWQIDIDGRVAIPALTVIAPGVPAPPRPSPAALGKRLFIAKGCIDCHANLDVSSEKAGGIGPDLTGRRFPDAYLNALLADPKSVLTIDPAWSPWEMPNLALKEVEVRALVAFINRDRERRGTKD